MSLLEQAESIRFVVNSDSAVERAQYIYQCQQGQCNVCEIMKTEADSLWLLYK